jgi:hypothetical protein
VGELHPSSTQRTFRFWAACGVLPFLNALVAFVGFPLVWYMVGHTGQQLTDPAQAARAFAIISGFFALIVTFGGAVPAVIWLMKRGPISLWHLIAVGLVLGNAPFLFYVIGLVLPATVAHLAVGTMGQHLMPLSGLIAGTLRALAIGSVMGTVSAIVLWFIGIRGTDAGAQDVQP